MPLKDVLLFTTPEGRASHRATRRSTRFGQEGEAGVRGQVQATAFIRVLWSRYDRTR